MTMRLSLVPVLILLCASAAAADETADAYQISNDLEAAGQYRQALEAMAGVAAPDRAEYVYHLRRGWLHYLSGDHRESVASYRRAIAGAPRAVEPHLGLMLPQMALRLWRDAEQTGADALALDPKNYLAGSRRAWALFNLGRFDEAEVAYRRVLELYPSDVDMRSGLGWCLLELGRPSDAATQFRSVLRVSPTDSTALQGLANSGG